MRQASTAAGPHATSPAGSSAASGSEHDVLGAEQVNPFPAVPLEGQRQDTALGQDRQQPRRRLADRRATQGQAAPRQLLHLHLGAQQEATQARRHRLAVTPVDVEHEALPVGAGHPQQGGQLPVGLEQERIRRTAHRQGATSWLSWPCRYASASGPRTASTSRDERKAPAP